MHCASCRVEEEKLKGSEHWPFAGDVSVNARLARAGAHTAAWDALATMATAKAGYAPCSGPSALVPQHSRQQRSPGQCPPCLWKPGLVLTIPKAPSASTTQGMSSLQVCLLWWKLLPRSTSNDGLPRLHHIPPVTI